jgi:glycine cleavage system H protein
MLEKNAQKISRREFLKEAGLLAGGAAIAAGASCSSKDILGTTSNDTPPTTIGNTDEVAADPETYRYSLDHIWVRIEEQNRATIGITQRLWDIATNRGNAPVSGFSFPETGNIILFNDSFGSIETLKIKIELIAPVSGKVIKVNKKAMRTNDVYGDGWITTLQLTNPDEITSLMTWEEYSEYIAQTVSAS